MTAGAPCDTSGLACPYQDSDGCPSFAVCDGHGWVLARSTSCNAPPSQFNNPPPTRTPDAGIENPDASTQGDAGTGADAATDSAIPDSSTVTDSGTLPDAASSSDADTDAASTCDLAQEGWQYWWDTLIGYASACTQDSDCEYITLGDQCRELCAVPMNASRIGSIAAFMQNYAGQSCAQCPTRPITCPTDAPPAVFCDQGSCAYVTPWQ
jgi:hypothetical protein